MELPPLRERHGDVELLARHFVEEIARQLGRPVELPEGIAKLEEHASPGNVRVLANAVALAAALAEEVLRA